MDLKMTKEQEGRLSLFILFNLEIVDDKVLEILYK